LSWLDAVIQGVLLGGLYALFAAGLSLIFGIMRLVNLAHGDLIVLGAFVLHALVHSLGLGIFAAFVVGAVVMSAIGYALQYGVFNRVLGKGVLPPLVTTFGLSIIVQNGLLQAFSADSRRLDAASLEIASLRLGGGLAVGVVPLLTFVGAVLVIAALRFLSYSTRIGRAFRATSDDLETAQLMGIDTRRISAVAMAVSMLVALIAALFLGVRSNFDPSAGPTRLVFGFEAVIITSRRLDESGSLSSTRIPWSVRSAGWRTLANEPREFCQARTSDTGGR